MSRRRSDECPFHTVVLLAVELRISEVLRGNLICYWNVTLLMVDSGAVERWGAAGRSS